MMDTLKIKTIVLSLLFALCCINSFAQGYGELRGIIKNTELESVPFATIKILQGSILIGGTQSDVDGNYKYKPLNPGTYDIIVMEAGHKTQQVNKIQVIPNEATYVDVKISPNSLGTVTVTAKAYDYTKAGSDNTTYTVKSIPAEELLQMAGSSRGDIKGVLTSITSDVIETNGEIHFRGTRGDATAYFVDGVRTLGASTVPGLCIENLTVFSGGVPAMYGDLMGGAVIVTTKGYFSGLREKNMRNYAYKEKIAEKKRLEKVKIDEENRVKEIADEKIN